MAGITFIHDGQELSADEAVALGAKSPDDFYRMFFARTVRQPSADFHLELDAALESPENRLILAEMFRDSGKTSRLRMWLARRIAYGMSKTIFFLGASEGHASRSVKWIRKQIEFNTPFIATFGLKLGDKRTETELEVYSTITDYRCWVLGSGYTGNVRGINFDDYRPDCIVVDDVVTDENAATPEQREKVIELVDGAIKNSLAPEVDDPNAKMVVTQTPMARGDLTEEMKKDPTVRVISVPIWTEDTLDLPVDKQISRWPERWPTDKMRVEKKTAALKNRLSTFIREKEVRLVSPEKRSFRPEWLQKVDIVPAHSRNILSIDPVPPASEREVAQGLRGKDYEAIVVCSTYGEDYFIRDYEANRGHDPSWTVAKTFELALKYNIEKIVVEGIAYQRTLKWILEEEMRRRQKWYLVEIPKGDKRSKYNKIVSTLNGVASNGHLYCMTWMTDLIQQWEEYPDVANDDILDAVAQGLARLIDPVREIGGDAYLEKLKAQGYKVPRLGLGAP